MKKVFVYGALAERCPGSPFLLNVSSPREAVSALEANFGGVHELLVNSRVELIAGDRHNGQHLTEDQVTWNIADDEIHIIPVAEGSADALKTIIGVALIGVAIVMSGGTMAGLAAASFLGASAGTILFAGAGMVLAGLTATPMAKYEEREPVDQRNSSIYQGPTNTQEEGKPVPYVAGGHEGVIAGGVVVSVSLDIEAKK